MLTAILRRHGLLPCSAALILAWSAGVAPVHAAMEISVQRAAELLEDGYFVEARTMLEDLRDAGVSDAERERILELLGRADRRIRELSDAEVSLQKATLALKRGDVQMVEMHAAAAARSDSATEGDRRQATELFDAADALSLELGAHTDATLDQAVRYFEDGEYAKAKACLSSVVRAGAALSPEQRVTLDRYRNRIVDLEERNGRIYELDYAPGDVLRAEGVIEIEDEPTMLAAGGAESTITVGADAGQASGNPYITDAEPYQDDPRATTTATTASEPSMTAADPLDSAMTDGDRAQIQELLVRADEAFAESNYNRALDLYRTLLDDYAAAMSAEESDLVRRRINEANALLGQADAGVLDRTINELQILVQQATAEFESLMERARAALAAGDYQTARNDAAQAGSVWRNANSQGLLADDQFRERERMVTEFLDQVEARAEAARTDAETENQAKLAAEIAAAERKAEEERETKIAENLRRLRALQMEGKYSEALQVTEQILFLDPINPPAMMMKDVLRDLIQYRQWEEITKERGKSYLAESVRQHAATIIPEGLVDFPADWPAMSYRRGEVINFVENPADKAVLATLENVRIPANFQNAQLSDVLDYIATITNLNHDVDWGSLEDIGIERDEEVTLELREVPARVVLDRVLEKVSIDEFTKAGWAVNDGILVVASDQALRKNTFIVIYDIRDLLFQIPNYGNVPTLDLDSILDQGEQGGGGGGSSFFEDDQEQDGGDGVDEDELMRRILEIIQTNVDYEGWRDNGGDTGIVQELNGNLIITNTANNHREIQGLLSQLREIRSIQVNVETRFLIVNQDFFEQIGFDLDVYFNADNNQFQDAVRQQEAFGLGTLTGEGVPTLPSDLIGGRTGETTGYFISDPATGAYDFGAVPFAVTQPDPLSIIPVQQGSDALTEALISGAFATEVLALNPALGVAGTFLDDIQVDFLVEATQADRRNVSLTAPRLTFTNGRAANVSVVRQTAFISDLTPVVGTGSVAFDPEVDVVNSGFSLLVRGVVSADRRYVTLTIQTGISQLEEFATGQVFATAAGQGDGGGASEPVPGTFQLPVVSVTQINTGATIPDKGTMLIGGQRLTTEIEVETGVPVLSKIPFLKRFFTNRIESKEESTLLILVKPTILIQKEQEEDAFPGLLDSLDNPFLR